MSEISPENKKQRSMLRFQALLGVFFGLMYVGIAAAMYFMVSSGSLENGIFDLGKNTSYAVMIIFVLYGAFRVGRAFKIFKSLK